MDVALTQPQERYDALLLTGRATIALRDARRLATLRPVGTRSPAVLARFVAFFTAEVAKALIVSNPRGEGMARG